MLKSWWEEIKAFFHYSVTIVIARATMLTGLLTTVVGSVDWSPVFNGLGLDTGFSWKQTSWLGIGIFVKGVIDELGRRRTLTT